jgi:ATP synthase mitochondrial F1 complex assembly factor 2
LQGAYQVYLDRRVLKTPARQPLTLPTEPLALAIAAEWEWQRQRIEPNTMPLMSLAATAIDQPQHRDIVIETMVSYIAADPVICRLDASPLAEKQAAVLNPVLAWMENHVGVALEPSCSIFAEDPPETALDGVRRFLQSFDDWELAAAEQLAATCKSVCLALKAVRGGMSIDDVLRAARVEEDHQIAEWGLVEGGHDLDLADMKVRVAAPCVFLGLIRGGDGV